MYYDFNEKIPKIDDSCFVAANATVLGDVTMHKDANVWYGAVLRADSGGITLGEGANVQDNAVVHMDEGGAVHIGAYATVGHGAIVHGCTVGEGSLVGMGATLLNHCVVGKGCIIGAGALVPEGMVIPDGALAVGVPAKVRANATEEQIEHARQNALHYVALAKQHKALV